MHTTIRPGKASLRLAAVVLASGTAVGTFPGIAAQAQEPAASQARDLGTLTNFGFDATAYGSKTSGNPNADSDATGVIHLPCTRYVPRDRSNHVAEGGDGDGVMVREVDTHNFTRQKNGVTSATSTVHVEGGTLADGAVRFTNLNARNRSLHAQGAGYGVRQASNIGNLVVAGTPVPTPGGDQSFEVPVPGEGTLVVNERRKIVNGRSAFGIVNALKFIGNDGTVERIGHAQSRIDGEVEGGVLFGGAWGSQGSTADGTVTSRKGAYQPMPCIGTNGEVLETSTGEAQEAFGLIGARRSFAFGLQRDNGSATGYTRSVVDTANFGVLELRNIRGRANVTRQADGDTVRTAKGTGVGEILIAGEPQPTPAAGEAQSFPGGEFTIRVVEKTRRGIDVTGAVVRLFNGTPQDRKDDTIVDLARAKLLIAKG